MGKLAFETLGFIFGGTFIERSTSLMKTLINALKEVFQTQTVNNMLAIFISVSITLLTLYLFIEVANRATTEQLTLERLILILVKFFASFVILANIQQIITVSFDISMAVYDTVETSVSKKLGEENSYGGLQFFPEVNSNPDEYPSKYTDEIKDKFKEAGYKDGNTSYIKNMSSFFTCLLFKMIMMVVNVASYLIVVGNAISLIARTVFAPIGMIQLMEDGSKSAGVRYLKKFLADGITLAVILVVLYAVSLLQGNIVVASIPKSWHNELKITTTVLDSILNIKSGLGLMLLSVQLAAVGAMFKASQIANDVVGV